MEKRSHPEDGAWLVAERYRGLVFTGRPAVPGRRPATAAVPAKVPARLDAPHPEEELSFVREVLRLADLDPCGYRPGPLIRRVPACLRALRARGMEEARATLAERPATLAAAVNALLIGSTGFFRDPLVFLELEKQVMPRLLARNPAPRIWSAACSDGMELCAVAVLADGLGAGEGTVFLGSDCRPAAVEIARRGVYPAEALAGVPERLAVPYFHSRAGRTGLRPELSRRLEWRRGDVLRESTGGPWDMILCRNLAIYLEDAVVRALWNRLADALVPGGILVTGRAEKPARTDLVRLSPCIYQKLPLPAP